ncbi:MAG: hypothetical protein K5656_08930, partial [Lachnospiraceae bacterium]|nr:hypothetical protein [Lachnospiraceae bacterium]
MKKLFNWIKAIVKIGMIAGLISTIVGYIKNLNLLPDYDEHKPYGIYEEYFKRPLDLALSLMAILALA